MPLRLLRAEQFWPQEWLNKLIVVDLARAHHGDARFVPRDLLPGLRAARSAVDGLMADEARGARPRPQRAAMLAFTRVLAGDSLAHTAVLRGERVGDLLCVGAP